MDIILYVAYWLGSFLVDYLGDALWLLCLSGIVFAWTAIEQRVYPNKNCPRRLQSCIYVYKKRPLRRVGGFLIVYAKVFGALYLVGVVSYLLLYIQLGAGSGYYPTDILYIEGDLVLALVFGLLIRKKVPKEEPGGETLAEKVEAVYRLYDNNSRPFLQRVFPNGTEQMEQSVVKLAEVCDVDLNKGSYVMVYELLSMYGEILDSTDSVPATAEYMKNYYYRLHLTQESAEKAVCFVRGDVVEEAPVVVEEEPVVVEEAPEVVEEAPEVVEEEPAVVEEAPVVIEEAPEVVEEEPAVVEEEPAVIEEEPVVVEEIPAASLFCFHCGEKLWVDGSFCPACGMQIKQPTQASPTRVGFCYVCGQRLSEHHRFCIHCGTKAYVEKSFGS